MLRPSTIAIRACLSAALFALAVPASVAQANPAAQSGCGEVVTIQTHGRTTTRYVLASPQNARMALVLLVGGGGHLDLDEKGCPRALKGNSLVRSLPHFHEAGFVTALLDAPSDHAGEDGLGGFRTTTQHAEDIGKAIAGVRARIGLPVWLVGTSRGSISAANAAAHLSGPSAPDGVVLTSALMSGFSGGRKQWVAQTVFDVPLEKLRVPILVVGHAADSCVRSPPGLMANITARANGIREHVVTVSGGPGASRASGIEACEGRSPHGFLEQEAEVAAGIARFIYGGNW